MSSPISSRPSSRLANPPLSPTTSRKIAHGAGSATRNPLSLRIYKVLGANFDDPSTREAFETLANYYPSEKSLSSAPKLENSKVTAGTESDSDAGDDTDPWAVKWPAKEKTVLVLPPEAGTTAARARQSLQRDIEGILANEGQKFLNAFAEKLDVLQEHVQVMNAQCEAMENRLRVTNQSCKYLLERAEGLRAQKQTTAACQEIITLFLERFALSPAEVEAITSRDVPVGRRMFDAMDKLERIREDCRVLMNGEGGETKAGLDIMASTAEQLEEAFQKLQRWCLFEFRQLGRDAHVEVEPIATESVRRLRKRPTLLQ
ncbi:Golgi transport complex subunit 6 [Ceratobasidium sp. 414]|nr:Golgi transport complex subunit 6 [Ceratobasidium sp. 414]